MELFQAVVYNKQMKHTKPLYLSAAERFPLTHTMLDEVLGRYVLKAGSVTKFIDIMHDCGTGSEAQFVIRWGRLDRPNFQTRRETMPNLLRVVGKATKQKYELEDKNINSWREEEKKLLNQALNVSLEDKNKKTSEETPTQPTENNIKRGKHKM